MRKNNTIKKICWKFFLIVVVPLLIYLWIFSSINPNNYQFEKRGNAMALDDDCPSLKCSLRQIINIPFRSDHYKFCFIDSGGSKSYPYSTQLTNGEETKLFNITSEGKYCEIVNLNLGVKTLIQEGSNSFNIGDLIAENKTIVVEYGRRDVKPIIKPEFWSGVTKLILTFLASWAILFLIREVRKYLFEN
ncbi:MAG: hypothetical protein PF542_01880 [Nanoarchaeota archaeon]|jgi:hypothetical protein|nr:hypothetical protein [Nanoarchaeota archaeon]